MSYILISWIGRLEVRTGQSTTNMRQTYGQHFRCNKSAERVEFSRTVYNISRRPTRKYLS